ncbi:MAG: glycosyltransferase, partial [Actinomycetota bacterium]
PDFVQDNVTGKLVPPSDPAALAEAVGALVRDPVGADRLGATAAEAARKLTWARAAEATLRVYERLNYGSLRPLPAAQSVITLARAEVEAALGGGV